MRPKDVRNLVRFNTHMGNYICPSHRDNVVAFVHGYEFCAGGACQFTKALSDCLDGRHRVKVDSLGWPWQVSRLAERLSLEWMEVYLLVSSEVLQRGIDPQQGRRRRKAAG